MITEMDLGNYLHLGDLSTDDAAKLAVEIGTGVVREYCGWYIYPAIGELLTLDGDGTEILKLPTMALQQVNSVMLDGDILTPDMYQWSTIGLLYYQYWTLGAGNVTVDFEHGLSERPSGPTLVALVVAAREYINPEPRLSEVASSTVRRHYQLNPLETRLLDPYRLP